MLSLSGEEIGDSVGVDSLLAHVPGAFSRRLSLMGAVC